VKVIGNDYSEEVKKHFAKPQNMGEMKSPDAVGELGNPSCGDVMKLYLKIGTRRSPEGENKKVEYIKDIKFQTMGCAAAIATSSMTTQLAKGKTLEEAKKISNKDVAEHLHGLPPIKMHCSNLAADALRKAIENWEGKN
jgi:nitrogen fixation NifU-like protein